MIANSVSHAHGNYGNFFERSTQRWLYGLRKATLLTVNPTIAASWSGSVTMVNWKIWWAEITFRVPPLHTDRLLEKLGLGLRSCLCRFMALVSFSVLKLGRMWAEYSRHYHWSRGTVFTYLSSDCTWNKWGVLGLAIDQAHTTTQCGHQMWKGCTRCHWYPICSKVLDGLEVRHLVEQYQVGN